MSEDTSRTITVCGAHGDIIEMFKKVYTVTEEIRIEQAKIAASISFVKWFATGVLSLAVTLLLLTVPFFVNLHTRVVVLEKGKVSYDSDNRRSATSLLRTSERGELRGAVEVDK